MQPADLVQPRRPARPAEQFDVQPHPLILGHGHVAEWLENPVPVNRLYGCHASLRKLLPGTSYAGPSPPAASRGQDKGGDKGLGVVAAGRPGPPQLTPS